MNESKFGNIEFWVTIIILAIGIPIVCVEHDACKRAGGHMVETGHLGDLSAICVKDGRVIEP